SKRPAARVVRIPRRPRGVDASIPASVRPGPSTSRTDGSRNSRTRSGPDTTAAISAPGASSRRAWTVPRRARSSPALPRPANETRVTVGTAGESTRAPSRAGPSRLLQLEVARGRLRGRQGRCRCRRRRGSGCRSGPGVAGGLRGAGLGGGCGGLLLRLPDLGLQGKDLLDQSVGLCAGRSALGALPHDQVAELLGVLVRLL